MLEPLEAEHSDEFYRMRAEELGKEYGTTERRK